MGKRWPSQWIFLPSAYHLLPPATIWAALRRKASNSRQSAEPNLSAASSLGFLVDSGGIFPTHVGRDPAADHDSRVSVDLLLFEKDERGPDEDLKLLFEAVSTLDPEKKKTISSQGMDCVHQQDSKCDER
jgi:hypothetical protein